MKKIHINIYSTNNPYIDHFIMVYLSSFNAILEIVVFNQVSAVQHLINQGEILLTYTCHTLMKILPNTSISFKKNGQVQCTVRIAGTAIKFILLSS